VQLGARELREPSPIARAMEAFALGQSVRLVVEGRPLTYDPERAGMCAAMLANHPGAVLHVIGDVSDEVRSGEEIPRVFRNSGRVFAPGNGARPPLDRFLEALTIAGYPVRQKGRQWRAKCPYHGGQSSNSLSVTETADGTALVHCFSGCPTVDVVGTLGLVMADLFVPAEKPDPLAGASPKRGPRPNSQLEVLHTAQLPARKVDYLWRGRIARGKLTAIGGDPGVGKGTLGIDLAARFSTGRPFPDGHQAPIGRVWLLTGEDAAEDTIVPRLIAAQADRSRVDVIGRVTEIDQTKRRISLDTDPEWLLAQAATAGVMVLIIDPIASYVGTNTNTWRDSDYRQVLDPLAEAAARHNVAVLIVLHLNKDRGRKAMYRFQGSIAAIAGPRFALLLAPHPQNPDLLVIACVKTNLAHRPASLTFRIVSVFVEEIEDEIGAVEWVGSSPLTADELTEPGQDGRTLDRAKTFLLDYLADGAALSDEIKAAAKAARVGRDPLWAAKGELGVRAYKDGLERWYWELPKHPDGWAISNHSHESRMLPDASVQNWRVTHSVSKPSSSLGKTSNHPKASDHTDTDGGRMAHGLDPETPPAAEAARSTGKRCPDGLLCSITELSGSLECCGHPLEEGDE
jgi:hypothetical protein